MMRKILLYLLGAGMVITLSNCKDDESEPEIFLGSWILTEVIIDGFPEAYTVNNGRTLPSFYGESSYTLEFLADSKFERSILSTPSFGDLQDKGAYSTSETGLFLSKQSGNTFTGIHNSFVVTEKPDETNFIIQTDIMYKVVSNEIWDDPEIGGALDLNDPEAVNEFYTLYGTSQKGKVNLEFERQ